MDRSATAPRRPVQASAPVATAAVWAPCANVAGRYMTAALVAISSVQLAQPLQLSLPELPKISLPKISLPKIGGDGDKKTDAPVPVEAKNLNVKVRAGGVSAPDAPTLTELAGKREQVSIGDGEGWKQYPSRRMPGANMSGWKEAAKEMKLPPM